jgi:hypothetical protein
MVPTFVRIIGTLLTEATAAAENDRPVVLTVVRIIGALLLMFSAYSWIGVFFPRWRLPMWWRGSGTPIGTFGHAGWAFAYGAWGFALIALSVNDSEPGIGRTIALVLLISWLAVGAGSYLDGQKKR